MTRRNRLWWAMAVLASAVLASLAGCGSAETSTTLLQPTPTQLPATSTSTVAVSSPTTVPTPGSTTFTCPATVNGTQKTFSDSQIQLSFTYPAAWTESHCQRIVAADGTETLFIGNLFSVTSRPRAGRTIQQWVSSQTDQYEVVTLGPLAVPHALSAMTVSAQPAATPNPTKPFDGEPFAQTMAIVAGAQHFYEVNFLIAEMSASDTAPGSIKLLLQQVVTTFVVP